MPSYSIEHKVLSVARMWGEKHLNGYAFKQERDFESARGVAHWRVTKQVEADRWHSALKKFYKGLLPILDGLAVITRCAITSGGESYLVRRIEENPTNIFFIHLCTPRPSTPMGLWTDEQEEDLNTLLQSPEVGAAMHYMRSANSTHTVKTRLTMLTMAAEALAGKIEIKRTCPHCGREIATYSSTDRDRLQDILRQESYDALYRKDCLRHKLFHGALVADGEIGLLSDAVYDALWTHVTQRLNLKSTRTEVVGAPRTFEGTVTVGRYFLRPTAGRVYSLSEVAERIKPHEMIGREFEWLTTEPDGY